MTNSKSLWLSSLTLSNDSLEGRLVDTTIMRVAARDKLDVHSQEKLRWILELHKRLFDGLGFCLSERGDLLSQWRGYADDAKGVSIGFSRRYLESLARASRGQKSAGFALHRVEYEPSQQEILVEPTYRELRKLIAAGAFRSRGPLSLLDHRSPEQIATDNKALRSVEHELIVRLFELLPMLFKLKSDAFTEEAEWRLVSMLVGKFDDCLFRASHGKVVPYRCIPLATLEVPAIAEVVLGPKHETPESVVESLLAHAGFGGAAVRRSRASYR
jgi:hypothetical protein